ncbi:uncharacterized protein LOC130773167 isoform X3 [Actinidia eriantha]|uniref:uncharacterized protein LOC130773167 isoform X3 n=1 Tax=Actinidia eriantha TaxID=165200 RepID=UPI00258B22DF|nr:uncharacterized protein LOC130773167 isoform X3 [Actinidia eriantha]
MREEDLFTMAYGLPLKGDGDEKCLCMLHAVEETISHQLRACKAPSSKKRVLEDVDLEEDYCKALLCRIRFRKLVISLLKILCANASWQQHKLGKILQDWQVIYIQLELAFQKDLGEISSVLIDERFIQHFELLQKASIPDQISYLSYKESTTQARSSNLEMHNCFKDAQRIAKELRSSFSNDQERMAELRRIEQVAEHNGVAINLICQLGMLDLSLKVYFEFCHHPYFATAVVKRS